MKKIRLLALALTVTLLTTCLVGCVTVSHRVKDIQADEISSISIYDLRDCTMREEGFQKDREPVYTLEGTKNRDFLDSLEKIKFSDTLVLLPIPTDPDFSYSDWVVRINFKDDSYRLVSCAGYGESFDAEGNRTDSNHYGCDDAEWEKLIQQYLPEELYK